MATPKIRMLCFAAETFPTHRVDVDVLFGRELVGRGHAIDFVMQAASEAEPAGPRAWNGRTVFVGRTRDGGGVLDRARRQVQEILHDLRSLLRLARRDDYDAIQVRDKFLVAAVAPLVARARGLRFFFWMSFPMPEADVLNARAGNAFIPAVTLARGLLTGWLLYRWILPRADHVYVQSERMKTQVMLRGIDPARITPVPMGVDLDSLPEACTAPEAIAPAASSAPMPRRSTAGRDVVIGYLGTLDASRRLEILVEMLALLRHEGAPARLLLIGDSVARRDRDTLSTLATERGVGQFLEITGMLPRAEAMRRMSTTDLAISPILRSPIFDVGSPTKLVEYMALGIPVVANTHPEQRLILRESRAGICVPWSARHFARGVRWLMSRPPGELEAMGRRGREWVLRHRAYPVIGAQLEQRYLQLLAPRATAAAAG